jgi:hypothetical protein
MKSFLLFFICFLLGNQGLKSQELPSSYHPLHYGLEVDFLSFSFKGYSFSAYLGMQQCRVRLNRSMAKIPERISINGVQQERINTTQIAFDFFINKDLKGFYTGPALSIWQTKFKKYPYKEFDYQSVVFSYTAGYNIFLTKKLYLAPYIALHVRVIGTQDLELYKIQYKPYTFLPEINFKLGWKFN